MNDINNFYESDLIDGLSSPNPDNQTRKRLKSWIIEQLDKNSCPGCEWINKETGHFKLVWKHYGRPGFDLEKDAKIFRDWAIHTRRYNPDEPAEVSKWKTRFRNALKKMNRDLEEVASMHQLEGNSPYRVYRFRTNGEIIRIAQSEIQSARDQKGDVMFKSPSNANEELEIVIMKQQLINNYKKLSLSDPFKQKTSKLNNDYSEDMMEIMEIIGEISSETQNVKTTTLSEVLEDSSVPMKSMTVNLYFSENQISSQSRINDQGVRIAYRPPPVPSAIVEQEGAKEVIKGIFGPLEAHQIYFPYNDDITDRRRILTNMERGLVVECDDNGDIYVTRLCIARVFYNIDVTLAPICLERSKKTLVFSFNEQFLPQLESFTQGLGKAPSYEICFSFAEKWSPLFPFKGLLTRCIIQHDRSKKLMNAVREMHCNEQCFSNKDTLDKTKEEIERIMTSSQCGISNTSPINITASYQSAIPTCISLGPPPPLPMNGISTTCMVASHLPPTYQQSINPSHSNDIPQFNRMNPTYSGNVTASNLTSLPCNVNTISA